MSDSDKPIVRPAPIVATKGGSYSWEVKKDAIEKFYMCGNTRMTSELTGVSVDTIENWKKQDWWQGYLTELKATERIQTDQKLRKIIDRSLVIMEDRLENGDVVLNNKTGELVRKPVNLRDTSEVANKLMHQRIQLEKANTEIQVQKETMQDTLKLLANEFAKWNKNNQPKQSLQDVVIIENEE